MRLELTGNLKRWRISFLLVVFVLSGCGGGSLKLSINSSPQWATLYQGNEKLGLTPIVVKHKITEKDKQQGYAIIPEMRVLWLSGAEAHHNLIQIPLENYSFTFERLLVPGLETDTMYEVQREILKATKENERAIRRAESAAKKAGRGSNHCTQRWSNGVLYCN